MLAASVAAQAAASVATNGWAFLIPAWREERGLGLVAAGTLAAMPIAGTMLTLLAWGLLADRWGERRVLLTGLTGTAAASLVAARAEDVAVLGGALLLVGAAAASTSSASGRVVVGWFPPERRGLAMGVRQMAQPLGVAFAAATMAVTADRAGVSAAGAVPVLSTLVALLAVAVLVLDPPRPRRTPALAANPYRAGWFLARVHGVSVLLVVPQFLVWTYSLTWLVDTRGWSPGAAGALVAVTHVAGALGRIAVGHLSDVVGSRVRPLRWVAAAAGTTMALLALTEPTGVAVLLLVVASTVTVADNGLAFTSVAEHAGPFWSGRALGVQNTGQNIVGSAVPIGLGALVGATGYAAGFTLAALAPLAAIALTPVRLEPTTSRW